jgi:hypothetical protein
LGALLALTNSHWSAFVALPVALLGAAHTLNSPWGTGLPAQSARSNIEKHPTLPPPADARARLFVVFIPKCAGMCDVDRYRSRIYLNTERHFLKLWR